MALRKASVVCFFVSMLVVVSVVRGHSHSHEAPHMKYTREVNEAAQRGEDTEHHGHSHGYDVDDDEELIRAYNEDPHLHGAKHAAHATAEGAKRAADAGKKAAETAKRGAEGVKTAAHAAAEGAKKKTVEGAHRAYEGAKHGAEKTKAAYKKTKEFVYDVNGYFAKLNDPKTRVWTYSIGATLLISACPFVILAFHPHSREPRRERLAAEDPTGHHEPHDMGVGLWVLAGVAVFFVVEKFVRIARGEDGAHGHSHGHALAAPPTARKPKKPIRRARGRLAEHDRRLHAQLHRRAGHRRVVRRRHHHGSRQFDHHLLPRDPARDRRLAILVKSGYTKRQAMFTQLLTALGALLGCCVALWSADPESLSGAAQSSWILPFTGGRLHLYCGRFHPARVAREELLLRDDRRGGRVGRRRLLDCGNQLGAQFWAALCREHGIGEDGYQTVDEVRGVDNKQVFFDQADNGRYIPRAVLIDLEPRGGGAGNMWTEGYTQGSQYGEEIMRIVRAEAEGADNLDGFIVSHSVNGGTGSGLGSRVLELIREEYPKQMVQTYSVFPTSGAHDVLSDHATLDHVNQMVATILTATTAPMRFFGATHNRLSDQCAELAPFNHMHFMQPGYTPFVLPFCRKKLLKTSAQDTLSRLLRPVEHDGTGWSGLTLSTAACVASPYIKREFKVSGVLLANHTNIANVFEGIQRQFEDFAHAEEELDECEASMLNLRDLYCAASLPDFLTRGNSDKENFKPEPSEEGDARSFTSNRS
ncbi:Tubulin gamma-1 chain [Aphelenchoides fujianensis]|nr:Tubulin gamma-1 chain [Aphelenchoides fujianensis]